VTLTVRVTECTHLGGRWADIVGGVGYCYLASADLDTGTLMPRPIQVGDRVTWGNDTVDYEVLVIREGGACLADARIRDSHEVVNDGLLVAPVSSLVKVSP